MELEYFKLLTYRYFWKFEISLLTGITLRLHENFFNNGQAFILQEILKCKVWLANSIRVYMQIDWYTKHLGDEQCGWVKFRKFHFPYGAKGGFTSLLRRGLKLTGSPEKHTICENTKWKLWFKGCGPSYCKVIHGFERQTSG